MDSKTKKFQTILLVILGVGLAVGLMIFSGLIKTKPKGGDATLGATGSVVIWGTFPNSSVATFINTFNAENEGSVVSYTPVDPLYFDQELLEAFARGESPDIVILPHTLIARYQDKLITLNEEALPLRNFRDSYSQGAEIFRTDLGTVGLPVAVDPLVMYYNRDLLESAGFINPPKFWNEDFLPFIESTTEVESDGLEIVVAGVPLGEATNINHAVEIISAIAMQLGSPITSIGQAGFEFVLDESSLVSNAPGAGALEYFTNFANPSKPEYSWNKDMSEARDVFALGQSVLYFGFGSELLQIQRKNPNLNFDVAPIPQIKEVNKSLTYGTFYALAVPKLSKNVASAFTVAGAISNGSYTNLFLDAVDLQPVRKDLLSVSPSDVYQKVFFNAGIVARAWITPNPFLVETIFTDMIEGVNSGRLTPERAISEAGQKIDEAF